MSAVQFATVRSFVDAPFFSELSKYKLEHAKLDTATIDLQGLVASPLVANRLPSVRLGAESFNSSSTASKAPGTASTGNYTIPGRLLNLNTIEEFKNIDKIELLKDEVRHLGKLITSDEALQDSAQLLRFFVLTFADIKKYKFYYWFMFPAFGWTSQVTDSALEPSSELDRAMSQAGAPVCVLEDGQSKPLSVIADKAHSGQTTLGVVDLGSSGSALPWHLRNLAAILAHRHIRSAEVYLYRRSGGSRWISLQVKLGESDWAGEGAIGWERNSQNKLSPKLTDLSSLMNPLDLADQAIDLNLKLMKWRAAPQIDLDAISSRKCLLLGAGTLGSYLARGLMAWGVRHITFVDNGKVSYSNPVRQPLYTHQDCADEAGKAETAAKALKTIFPGINSKGVSLYIPMAGHPITSEERQHQEYDHLVELISEHDTIFLLMDSRESRWLPTVISQALGKTVINVALGFDSFLVMRHGIDRNLGCYFCNDVVAPSDSISQQTLDQMCTVTRPGGAMIASGFAVELLAQICQHEQGASAPADAETTLGPMAHQLRGFLGTKEIIKIWGPAFPSCSACGPSVRLWQEKGWDFVKRALNDPMYVTETSGLGDLQRQTEDLDLDSGSDSESSMR